MEKVLIPFSIILAGIIIAGSILVTGDKIILPSVLGLNPSSVKSADNLVKNNDTLAPGNQAQAPTGALQPPPLSTEPINVSLGTNSVQGSASAKVAVVEFGDFQCPYCGKFNTDVLSKLETDYINKGLIKFAYRDLAFLGQESKDAALAARCAGDQGKFWEYHDKLFSSQNGENQGAFKVDNLKSFAKGLGLNTTKFNSCLDSRKYDSAVSLDISDAQLYKVYSTPTVFINGVLFDSRFGYDKLYSTIDDEINKK